jgi:hypothetical protein
MCFKKKSAGTDFKPDEKLAELIKCLGKNSKDEIPKDQINAQLDLYKFFQERIESLRARLWTNLAWLAAVQGAALLFIVQEGGLRTGMKSQLLIDQPILVFLLSSLAFIIAYAMLQLIFSGEHHIESNFRKSNIALDPGYKDKIAGISPERLFLSMKILSWSAIFVELILMVISIWGVFVWLELCDIPFIKIEAKPR